MYSNMYVHVDSAHYDRWLCHKNLILLFNFIAIQQVLLTSRRILVGAATVLR